MYLFVILYVYVFFFFFKQKTAYEMRISDWSSDVCSSDLLPPRHPAAAPRVADAERQGQFPDPAGARGQCAGRRSRDAAARDREIGRASCRERVCQYV